MAGLSFSKYVKKVCGLLVIMPILALTGCGEGDGQVRIQGTAATPLPPGFEEPAPSLGVFSETHTDPVVVIQDIQQAGNEVLISTETVRVFEGNVSLGLTYTAGGQSFGGATILFEDANVSPYNTLKFSIDTSSFANFANLTVQLEPPGGGTAGAFVALADYTPVATAGVWETYAIPLADLPSVNLTLVNKLGFFNARDASDALLAGTLYVDDIHFTVTDFGGAGPAGTPIDPEVVLYATDGEPDLTIPDDYENVTGLESGSVPDLFYAEDDTYSKVLSVFSGIIDDTNVAQVGFIGFDPGFVTFYEDLIFKVKGMPNFVIFVQLYEGGNRVRVNLSSSSYSSALGDGWYQVSIPLSRFTGVTSATGIVFESDDTSPMQFTFFLTDIGFSGTAGGDGGDGGNGGQNTLGVFSETNTDPAVNITDFVSAGNAVTISESGNPVFDGAVSLELAFSTGEQAFGGAIIEFENADLSAYDVLKFAIDTSTFAGFADLTVQLEPPPGGSAGNFVFLSSYVPVATSGSWETYEIPLADFTSVDPSSVNKLGFFNARDGADALLAGTLYLDDIHFATAGGGGNGGGPIEGDLAVNGGFDDGFTGWAQYPSAQTTQTIVVDGTTSSNVARLFIPASAGGVNNVLKQERLLDGQGVFSAGDVIQISFDYRGEPGEGILFVKSICETADPVCGDKIHNNGGPFVPAGWTNYTDTFTLGAGVTGYTLEFAAVCGGTGTCVADYFIDNVTITIQ